MQPNELPQEYADDPSDKKKVSKELRAYKIPLKMQVDSIVKFIFNDMGMKKYCAAVPDAVDHNDYIEILMETSVVAPEDGARQKFVVDPKIHIHTIYTQFWKRFAEEMNLGDAVKMKLYFRKKENK